MTTPRRPPKRTWRYLFPPDLVQEIEIVTAASLCWGCRKELGERPRIEVVVKWPPVENAPEDVGLLYCSTTCLRRDLGR